MTDLYTAALQQIDGYTDAVAALDRIAQARRKIGAGVTVRDRQRDIIDETIARVLAGGEVPADIGAQLVAAESAEAEHSAAGQVLDIVEDAARERVTQLKLNESDAALEFLDNQLGELMDAVKSAHRTCGKINTAEDAVAAGATVVEAWSVVQRAADTYDKIRQAQWDLLRDATGNTRHLASDLGPLVSLIGKAGLYRDVLAFHPIWRQKLDPDGLDSPESLTVAAGDPSRLERDATWPDPLLDLRGGIAQTIWPTTNRPAFVRWLASSTAAHAWVPTIAQMHAKSAEIDERIRAAHGDGTRDRGWSPIPPKGRA